MLAWRQRVTTGDKTEKPRVKRGVARELSAAAPRDAAWWCRVVILARCSAVAVGLVAAGHYRSFMPQRKYTDNVRKSAIEPH